RYAFDAKLNVTAVRDNLDSTKSWTYGYDSADRLASAGQNGIVYAYAYDHSGNLISKEGTAQHFFPSGAGSVHPHALCSTGGSSCTTGVVYGYDADGNLTSRSDGLNASWNAENMVTRESGGAATSTTQRWFLGESVWKKLQGSNTYYYLPGIRVENG